jgi:hypothetical protein
MQSQCHLSVTDGRTQQEVVVNHGRVHVDRFCETLVASKSRLAVEKFRSEWYCWHTYNYAYIYIFTHTCTRSACFV